MPLIVLEGPDGSGSTTHAALLAESLKTKGFDVLLTAEPTDGPVGLFIRHQLKGKTIPSAAAIQLAFCADRAWHVDTIIKPALQAGKVVISDRYVTSTLVYGEALGLDTEWLAHINEPFPKPDLEIFTLPPFEIGLKRMHERSKQDVLENRQLQEKVYGLYERLSSENSSIRVLDTSQSKEDAHKVAMGFVLSVLA